MEADEDEIGREQVTYPLIGLTLKTYPTSRFSLKLQKIVEDEQEANFISRLHAGKLSIIPW